MKEIEVLKQLQCHPGKNDKIRILKENDTPSLRKLLYLTYNRFLTYRIKQLDFPQFYNSVQPDIADELEMLLLLLAEHETGITQARLMIKSLLAKCTEEGAYWVSNIITRDLKVGIDESTINKAFPGLVPVFDVQLAHPIYSKGKKPVNRWLTLQYPVVVEEKLDGVRCIATVRGGKVTFQSREGHEFDDRGVFAAEILKLRPGTDFVLDGEIIAKKFNPDNGPAVKNKDSNWPYEQGKSMIKDSETTADEVKEYLGYYVWDILELDYFDSQGKEGVGLPLTERKLQLSSLFSRSNFKYLSVNYVPNAVANNEAEVRELFRRVRSKGGQKYSCVNKRGRTITYTVPKGEGVMVKKPDKPYEFTRSDAVLKVKEFYTCDLRIAGAYEGEPGTKYEGMLGGLEFVSDCGWIKTNCGSLKGDEGQRYELWVMFLRGDLVGKIGEVSYQEITADGSLRFPVFQGLRDDKTTTNVEG